MDLKTKKNIIRAIETAPSDAELSTYLQKVSKWLQPTRYEQSTITMRQAIRDLLKNEKPRILLTLGEQFSELNNFFFLTSGLHIIGAPSGHGKTLWAMKWAESAAKKNLPVLVVSLEMTPNDLSARTASEIWDISLRELVRNELELSKKQIMLESIEFEEFNYLDNIHIEKFGDYDWVKIKPRLSERMGQLRPKLIVVDYVQMISNSDEDDGRVSKMLSDISRELKLFADETDSAVLLLSQFNREALKETKKHLKGDSIFVHMSHEFIKESGGIVEAADSVQLVCMPQRLDFCPMQLRGKFQIGVHKSRRIGEIGNVLFSFDYEKMKFL